MTSEEIEILIAVWGSDPAPPILVDPWQRPSDSFGQERANKAALRNRPDLGWALAVRLARSGRHCALLKRPECRWIRAAVLLLGDDAKATRLIRDAEIVSEALELYRSDAIRPILNAVLMTREATAPLVADALKLKEPVVEAYADLFFNVLDRKENVIFLQAIMGVGRSDSLFVNKSSLPSEEEYLLAAGFTGTIGDVLRIAGLVRGGGDESEEELLKSVKRKVLKAGVKALEARGATTHPLPALAGHAIDLVKKTQIEQPASTEDILPGDFGSAAREVLKWDAANLKRAIEDNLSQSA